jgi:RHS repeat-associated protein
MPPRSWGKLIYDPLDRTVSKTEQAGTPSAKTTNFAYLGLSEQLVSEDISGVVQRTYQYDGFGRRLSQIKKDTDGGGPGVEETSYYGYTPHSDVEMLTKDNGDTRATYGYTAYGSDDQQSFTGIDKPDAQQPGKEPYNFYRYTAKRFDPASGSYDMGFRDYNPGLNRFLTRDTYNGALADLDLGTNPWTSNRYAFTGGNPISRIEIDGHYCDSCDYYAQTKGESTVAGNEVGCSYSTTGVCGAGYTEADAKLVYQWQTGTGDGSNQPVIYGHRLPTAKEMELGPIFTAPVMMAPGETYQQAVTHWATFICNSGLARDTPGFCEWSYTVGNRPANGWDLLTTIVSAALLAAPGGAGRFTPGAAVTSRAPEVVTIPGGLKLPGVPRGATGVLTPTGKGLQYEIPGGTPELDPRVKSIRVMDPLTTGKYQYPNGYVAYMNEQGQTVNPLTGQTVQPSDPLAHIGLP